MLADVAPAFGYAALTPEGMLLQMRRMIEICNLHYNL